MHFKRWPSDDRESSKSNLILNKTLFYKLSLNEGKIAAFETPQLSVEEDNGKGKSKTMETTETIRQLQMEGTSEISLLILIE